MYKHHHTEVLDIYYISVHVLVYNHFHNILRLFIIFLSPQGKLCAIINYKHGINELSHKLPNDLKLIEIKKHQESV